MPQERLTLKLCHELKSVDSGQWNKCANPFRPTGDGALPFDPFVSHEFLSALEISGSAVAETGWFGHHLLLENRSGVLKAAMPLYLKSHSRGEYVFDFGWADAFEKAGGSYYPKLQCAVPFTPVTGRRILIADTVDERALEKELISGAHKILDQYNASSLHFTFLDKVQWKRLSDLGFLTRIDQQFHWQNEGYQTFEDFLDSLSAKKRKNIRRERRLALESGIKIELLTGNSIQEHHWDHFFEFYQDTGSRKWGSPYLTRLFFSLIGESLCEKILLIMAKRGDRYVAGALNFIGGERLFGRYWGCLESHPFLHFEVCYYQAIQFAIEKGLARVEAGAQGEHKLARGYLPSYTYSAHWIANESFRQAIDRYLESERGMVYEDVDYLARHSPFRHHSGT